MTKDFKSTYDESEVFYLRADLLRPMFGHWDAEDPVSHAILDIVEAQRELSDAIADGEIAGYTSGYDNRTSLILFRHPGVNALVQCGILFDVTRVPRTIVNCYELR